MKRLFQLAVFFSFVFVFAVFSFAQSSVPKLLNFQGRVSVSGTPFTGIGQFKFALVDRAGTTTFWSNDASSENGSQPASGVAVEVKDGIYSVALGGEPMVSIPESVFAANSEVFLRVWFSDNVHGFELLTPDQQILSVGYAYRAAVADNVVNSGRQVVSGNIISSDTPGEFFDVFFGDGPWCYNPNLGYWAPTKIYTRYGVKTIPIADLDVDDMPMIKVFWANSADSEQWYENIESIFIDETNSIQFVPTTTYLSYKVLNNAIKLIYPQLTDRDNPNSYAYLSYISGSPSYNVFYKIVIMK